MRFYGENEVGLLEQYPFEDEEMPRESIKTLNFERITVEEYTLRLAIERYHDPTIRCGHANPPDPGDFEPFVYAPAGVDAGRVLDSASW